MKTYFHILLISFLLIVSSCIPSSPPRSKNLSSDGSSSSNGSSSNTNYELALYKDGYFQTLTVNSDVDDVLYLRGSKVETFLNTGSMYTSKFCVVINYRDLLINGTATNLQLRTRAVPISFQNFSTGKTERLLRLELQDKTGSAASCKGVVNLTNPNASLPTSFTELNASFLVTELCTNCLGLINSKEVFLYITDGVNLVSPTNVTNPALDVSSLKLIVDYANNATSSNNNCTDSVCIAQGFNCCLQGQCVNDGAQKPGVNTSDPNFITALNEVLSQPSAYTNYPEYFYICPGTTNPPNEDDDDGDPVTEAQEALAKLLTDKECVDELKNLSLTSPYTLQYLSSSSYPAGPYSKCNNVTTSDYMYIETVLTRLYNLCGCSQTAFTDKINNCPAYSYKITETDAAGNPKAVGCDVPSTSGSSGPFQDLDVNVNSRSVPHRYFKRSNGDPVDNLENFFLDTSMLYEGADFSYLDGANHMIPVNGDFNFNSIIGAFETTLDQALPAKVVNVEVNKSYLIETRSGFFQTCVGCDRDRWLNAFTPFPTANMGVGLKAIGHTTTRDQYSTNTTNGNYEDTHFGRACFIPPTMVPYSHRAIASANTQRQTRLKTQAALYMNGYQRDWFGFNKGAVIGSFDGVTWFAIGKGRIVTAKTTKLFLAINHPFGDLAQNSVHTVGVSEYVAPASAALYDWDPTIPSEGALQNEAGSCQKYHQCSTDSDCVSNLGWEYMCADVTGTDMYKPQFSSNANEYDDAQPVTKPSKGTSTVTFQKWIYQTSLPGASKKRCVYRGAGSVCRRDFQNITSEAKRKLLTCAPNFYCADPNSSVFNAQLVRYVGQLDALPLGDGNLFGMDADHLGRPLAYVTGSDLTSLPSDVQTSIAANLALNSATVDWGVCRPGKLLSQNQLPLINGEDEYNPIYTHQNADALKRTDYINQIGSCDADFNSGWDSGSGQAYEVPPFHINCPVIDTDGNYLYTKASFLTDLASSTLGTRLVALTKLAHMSNYQNACGSETLDSGGNSPFEDLERGELGSVTITTASMGRNACLRRAGQVCHTDLDCSPNKLHAQYVNFYSDDYFGNEAERAYWEESLICGQGEPLPQLSENDPLKTDDRYDLYQLKNNRCCRATGKDLTIYSEDMVDESFTLNADVNNKDFDTLNFGYLNSSDPSRYSRLASVDPALNSGLSARTSSLANNPNRMTTDQWKTLNSAASNSCCGGGWVRKFADGDTDWSRADRLSLNVSNFRCLNYQSPVPYDSAPTTTFGTNAVAPNTGQVTIPTANRDSDFNFQCQTSKPDATSDSGCIQVEFDTSGGAGFASYAPVLDTTNARKTVSFGDVERTFFNFNDSKFTPYSANPVQGNDYFDITGLTAGVDLQYELISFQMPSYIPADFRAATFNISLTKKDGTALAAPGFNCANNVFVHAGVTFNPALGVADTSVQTCNFAGNAFVNGCKACYYPTSGILAVRQNGTLAEDAYVKVDFSAPGTQHYETNGAASAANRYRSQAPGNYYFYLKRLGKLELSGVPQMFYEPLYCSDRYNEIVPGLFNLSDTNANGFIDADDFQAAAFTSVAITSTSPLDTPNNRTVTPIVAPAQNAAPMNDNATIVTEAQLDHEAVFSSHEFKCCIKLGTYTTSANLCCSGHSVVENGKQVCKLPAATNLSVYFNRYISSEGVGSTQPGGGFVDADFDRNTGEPLMNASVYNKIVALGNAYCESGKTRRGGAFGTYEGEPKPFGAGGAGSGGWSIVDSVTDSDDGSGGSGEPKGYDVFTQGFRWNHHVYCDF